MKRDVVMDKRARCAQMASSFSKKCSNLGFWSFLVLLLVATVARAQLSGTGAITGTVTDQTGAVIAGAKVTATDTSTNVKTTRSTTAAGDFTITPLQPGAYSVTVSAKGFQSLIQENITVDALSTVAFPVKLTVGSATETVTVTTAPPVLETSNATLGTIMDNEMYSNLPLQMGANGNADQRRVTDFAFLAPGVQSTNATGPLNTTSATGIVNGSGPGGNVQDVYIDGIDLPEADGVGDPRFTWTAIGVDAVNQFQVETNGISTQYAGQGIQNYSIKTGGNAFHGSVYEFLRNTMFDAWNFTNKVPTLNGAGVMVPGGVKARENQNEVGLVLSGPVVKDKLFFFLNYGQYRYAHGAVYSAFTMPTLAMLGLTAAGQPVGYADFSGYAAANGAANIYDPSTQTPGCTGTTGSLCSRTQFTNNRIPASRISQATNAYNKFIFPYEQLINQNSYSSNLNFGTPTGLSNWYSTARLDYTQNSRNQIGVIVAFGRQASTGPNSGSGLHPPFNNGQSYHPVTTIDIVKDTFVFSPHLVNQFAFGFGRYDSLSVTPNRAPEFAATGVGILGMPGGQASDSYPGIKFSGAYDIPGATWGGYSWNEKINNTYTITDSIQWQLGRHSINIGGQMVEIQYNYYSNQSGSAPASFTFAQAQTGGFAANGLGGPTSTTGSAFASYLLGAVNASSITVGIPGLATRWPDPSFWAQDDIKVSKNLTMNLGLRWDIFPAIREAHNVFTFLNPTGANTITGNLGTLGFAGYGSDPKYCNCTRPSPIYWKNIAPRVSLAYSMDPKTVLRASYTVNYARGDWTSGSQSGSPSQTGLTPSATAPGGINGMPAFYWDATACTQGSNNTTPCGFTGSIVAPTPPVGATSLAEYGTAETQALTNTGTFKYTYWDSYRGSRTPEYINWSVGLQRQLTSKMSISASYVGSQGHFLSANFNPAHNNALNESYAALAGYNVVGGAAVPCSQATCGQTATNLIGSSATAANIALAEGLGFTPPNPFTGSATYWTTNKVPSYFTQYPQFSGVSDTTPFVGNTNFNALEIQLREHATHGLDLMGNYTFSKSMDDVGTFRVNDNPRLDRSLSTADQPENVTATAVYKLPFGHDGIGANSRLVRSVAGGWTLSTIFLYHSGFPIPFTATGCGGNGILGQCMPSLVPGQQSRQNGSYSTAPGGITAANYTQNRYFNPNALVVAANIANGTGTSQQLLGTTVPTYSGTAGVAGNQTGTRYNAGAGVELYVPGNVARVGALNTFSMGQYNFDFALKRSFPIYREASLDFEVDMLNATNHVWWPIPNAQVGGNNFGQYTAGPLNQPRDFQLAGRINW